MGETGALEAVANMCNLQIVIAKWTADIIQLALRMSGRSLS